MIVCRDKNVTLYIKDYYNMKQESGELIMNFYTRLRDAAFNCEFRHVIVCTHKVDNHPCTEEHWHSFEDIMIHNSLITGLSDDQIASDYIFGENKTLNDTLKFLIAKESGKMDHGNLKKNGNTTNVGGIDVDNKGAKEKIRCNQCKRTGHGKTPKQKTREAKCPAWALPCFNCKEMGHFSNCCKKPKVSTTTTTQQSNTKPTATANTAGTTTEVQGVSQRQDDDAGVQVVSAMDHFHMAPILIFAEMQDDEDDVQVVSEVDYLHMEPIQMFKDEDGDAVVQVVTTMDQFYMAPILTSVPSCEG